MKVRRGIMRAMDVVQAIGILVGVVTGVSGLVLGILNYLHHRDTARPRLMVRPRVWNVVDRSTKEVEKNVGVMEVCNVGLLPVIGSTVGFLPKRKGGKGLLIVSSDSLNGVDWPGELKPGNVAMLRMRLDDLNAHEIGRAYASTIVGDTFTATRAEMRKFAEKLRDLSANGKRDQQHQEEV